MLTFEIGLVLVGFALVGFCLGYVAAMHSRHLIVDPFAVGAEADAARAREEAKPCICDIRPLPYHRCPRHGRIPFDSKEWAEAIDAQDGAA